VRVKVKLMEGDDRLSHDHIFESYLESEDPRFKVKGWEGHVSDIAVGRG
jgi:hypothetical protein